jgi:hypothetical protein
MKNNNKKQSPELSKTADIIIDFDRAKELIDEIETEIIVDKSIKLFNQLKAENKFEKPTGVSNNFFIWTMIVMAAIGLIAVWLL